jgi:pyrroloquinoline quinone biosynthesis protein A
LKGRYVPFFFGPPRAFLAFAAVHSWTAVFSGHRNCNLKRAKNSAKVPYWSFAATFTMCFREEVKAPSLDAQTITIKEVCIMWTKPAYEDLRIGFEVTMYFANR